MVRINIRDKRSNNYQKKKISQKRQIFNRAALPIIDEEEIRSYQIPLFIKIPNWILPILPALTPSLFHASSIPSPCLRFPIESTVRERGTGTDREGNRYAGGGGAAGGMFDLLGSSDCKWGLLHREVAMRAPVSSR